MRRVVPLILVTALVACGPPATSPVDYGAVFDGTGGRWVDLTHAFSEATIYWLLADRHSGLSAGGAGVRTHPGWLVLRVVSVRVGRARWHPSGCTDSLRRGWPDERPDPAFGAHRARGGGRRHRACDTGLPCVCGPPHRVGGGERSDSGRSDSLDPHRVGRPLEQPHGVSRDPPDWGRGGGGVALPRDQRRGGPLARGQPQHRRRRDRHPEHRPWPIYRLPRARDPSTPRASRASRTSPTSRRCQPQGATWSRCR